MGGRGVLLHMNIKISLLNSPTVYVSSVCIQVADDVQAASCHSCQHDLSRKHPGEMHDQVYTHPHTDIVFSHQHAG